jgi:hypothetical protein
MKDLTKTPETQLTTTTNQQAGAIGYILAWLLGIPVSVLLVIFLIRGCN